MTEEIENQTDFDSFSLFDVLDGVSYPTDEVTVALNEAAAYRAQALVREATELESPTEEQLADISERIAKARQEIEDSKVTFYLRGISDEKIASAGEIVDDLFIDKKRSIKSANGTPMKYLPQEHAKDYSRMLNAVVISMHIERMTEHKTGRTRTAPSMDEIAAFYDKAPLAAKQRLGDAVAKLRVDSGAYEAGLDEGFFPKS